VTFGEATDGRVAGHLADLGWVVSEEQGAGAKPRRRRGSLRPGMAATHHNNVEFQVAIHVSRETISYLPYISMA
jgi:hypothetical protein